MSNCCHFQHVVNKHQSPAKTYSELGSTIMKYLRKEVGEMGILPKKTCLSRTWSTLWTAQGR